MDNRKRIIILTIAVLLIAVTAFLSIRFAVNSKNRKQIPEIPELTTLPAPLRDQLTSARQKAIRNPNPGNIGNFGMALHSAAFYDKASECYNIAIRRDSKSWVWSYCLGLLNKEMGDSKASIASFSDVLKVNSKVPMAWYYLGKAYQNDGSAAKASEAFGKIALLPDYAVTVKTRRVNYSPVSTLGKFELARIYLNENKPDDAIKLLESITSTNHSIGPVYRLLGNAYSAKGDQVLSLKYITRAQDLAEVTSVADTLVDRLAFISRSSQYLPRQIDDAVKSANPEWALVLLKNSLRYLSDDKYIISKAVKFYLRMDTGNEAMQYLLNHFNLFRDDANEMTEVADMLYKKGFYKQSMPYFARAVELRPSNNELMASYALSCWYDHRTDSAFTIMKEMYEKNSHDIKVLANEAAFMIITRDYPKCESFISLYRQIAPKDAKVAKIEAMAAESQKDQLKAIPYYESSFKTDPSDLETARKYGSLLLDQKMWDKAMNMFRTALDKHPNDPYLLERLGALLISCPDPKLRNTDEGLEYSERAFFHISSPSNTMISAARSLAQGYAMKGNFQQATYYITLAISLAQGVNAPKDFMDGLINLASKIQHFSQKK